MYDTQSVGYRDGLRRIDTLLRSYDFSKYYPADFMNRLRSASDLSHEVNDGYRSEWKRKYTYGQTHRGGGYGINGSFLYEVGVPINPRIVRQQIELDAVLEFRLAARIITALNNHLAPEQLSQGAVPRRDIVRREVEAYLEDPDIKLSEKAANLLYVSENMPSVLGPEMSQRVAILLKTTYRRLDCA